MTQEERIYIREAAELLNRKMNTLRKWEQLDVLPEELRAHRGIRGWRYWTPEQIGLIRDWIRDTDRRPGKALAHYNPTEQQLDKALEAMRGRRKFGNEVSVKAAAQEAGMTNKRDNPFIK